MLQKQLTIMVHNGIMRLKQGGLVFGGSVLSCRTTTSFLYCKQEMKQKNDSLAGCGMNLFWEYETKFPVFSFSLQYIIPY